MNKTFASLSAAVIVTLATSLAAAQASAVVLAPEVHALHVVTPHVVAPRVVAPLVGPVRVPVVRPRVRPGVNAIAPVRRGGAVIRR